MVVKYIFLLYFSAGVYGPIGFSLFNQSCNLHSSQWSGGVTANHTLGLFVGVTAKFGWILGNTSKEKVDAFLASATVNITLHIQELKRKIAVAILAAISGPMGEAAVDAIETADLDSNGFTLGSTWDPGIGWSIEGGYSLGFGLVGEISYNYPSSF